MPVISRFLGIAIAILYRDHDPPHFHAIYGEYEITVNILDGVVNGQFPRRALSHVLEWHQQHLDELMLDWEKARRHEPLSPIAPLEYTMLHVTSAQVLPGLRLLLQFNDGTRGEADVADQLIGPIFEELLDQDKFSEAYLDPELRTVCWPNGADMAPEFLRTLVMQKQPV